MTESEFRDIRGRIAVDIDNHDDALALAREVSHLRDALRTVRGMTGDPAIVRTVAGALEEEGGFPP